MRTAWSLLRTFAECTGWCFIVFATASVLFPFATFYCVLKVAYWLNWLEAYINGTLAPFR